jgi:hypothetical protein
VGLPDGMPWRVYPGKVLCRRYTGGGLLVGVPWWESPGGVLLEGTLGGDPLERVPSSGNPEWGPREGVPWRGSNIRAHGAGPL